jgi:hypothetical protein
VDAFVLHSSGRGSLTLPETTTALRSLGFNITDAEVREKGPPSPLACAGV